MTATATAMPIGELQKLIMLRSPVEKDQLFRELALERTSGKPLFVNEGSRTVEVIGGNISDLSTERQIELKRRMARNAPTVGLDEFLKEPD